MLVEVIAVIALGTLAGGIAAHLCLGPAGLVAGMGSALLRAPFPVWVEQKGAVVWANRQCRRLFGPTFTGRAGLMPRRASRMSDVRIIDVARDGGVPEHYSLLEHPDGDRTVVYALDAQALMETEAELRRFIQTLAATFAHLPIGLAIFDRTRNLTMFNPALSDLLSLSPDWMARRPSLSAFLDRLRNNGSLPEPRDYTSLKQEFAALESGAFSGVYEVEWMLPSGRLYRVSGRPHAEGGAALLFEDISRSAAIEAQYQIEMRQLHGALECLTDGVAVFDAAGELAYANDAFDDLWDCTLSRSVQPVQVTEVSRLFQDRCLPNPAFGEMRDFVLSLNERSDWQADVTLRAGGTVAMRFVPIAEGRVVCEFRLHPAQDAGAARAAASGAMQRAV